MNSLQYSLIISISAHASLLVWLILTVPSKNNRIPPIKVVLLSPPSSLFKSQGSSPIEQSQKPVNRNQPATSTKPLTSRQTGATAENLEKFAPQSAGSLAVDSGIAPFSAAEAVQGDQAGDIAIGSGSSVSAPEGVSTGTKGATSRRTGPSVDSTSAPARSSTKSSTPSDMDSASGAVIPGYVIDAAGHRPPDAGAIYPEVDKYVLYGADKRTPMNVLGTEVYIEGEFLRSKEAVTISEVKTDYSKCRYLDFGDESV